MTREFRLQTPLTQEQMRELNVGDTVYLSGIVHTMRDMGHRRAVDMLAHGERLPFDLTRGIIWHAAPIVRQTSVGRWEAVNVGSTTSSRFTYLGSELMRQLNLRCIVGKGSMLAKAVETMQEVGSCFLNTTGGCAALYGQQVEEVVNVHWTDLGLPEAIWVLRMKDFGPLIVGIDSHGQSLFDNIGVTMRQHLASVYQKSRIDIDRSMSYLPKRVIARSSGGKW
jgi:fumarate hydratase subunit beta